MKTKTHSPGGKPLDPSAKLTFSTIRAKELDQARRWLAEHEAELPAVLNYDPFLACVQRAVSQVRREKKLTWKSPTSIVEACPEPMEKPSSAVYERVEAIRFREGEASGQESDLIERLASGYHVEALESYFRHHDGESFEEIASGIRIEKSGELVHPRPSQVRRWIHNVNTWLGEINITGESKARFLAELGHQIGEVNKAAAWQRITHLDGDNSSYEPVTELELGVWWETIAEMPDRSPKDLDEAAITHEPPPCEWRTTKALAGGRHWDRKKINVKAKVSSLPSTNFPPVSSCPWSYQSPSENLAVERDRLHMAEVEAARALTPKIDLTPKQIKLRELEAGLLTVLDSSKFTEHEKHEFVSIVDALQDGRTIAEIAGSVRLSEKTVKNRIRKLRESALNHISPMT